MARRRELIVVGAGGLGQEVVWAARNLNSIHPTYDILGYVDDDRAKKGRVIYGQTVLGTLEEVAESLPAPPAFICAIGTNATRAKVVARVLVLGWTPVTVIDPSVIAAEGVTLGEGSYVAPGSILAPNAQIGSHVIINTCCTIGHDSRVGDFVQVSPGGRVSGGVVLHEGAMLGSNAAVAPLRSVGRYATVGACSFAMTNIPDGATAVGVPARVVAERKE